MSMAAEHTSRALTFRQYSTGCAEPQRVRTPHVLEETLEVGFMVDVSTYKDNRKYSCSTAERLSMKLFELY